MVAPNSFLVGKQLHRVVVIKSDEKGGAAIGTIIIPKCSKPTKPMASKRKADFHMGIGAGLFVVFMSHFTLALLMMCTLPLLYLVGQVNNIIPRSVTEDVPDPETVAEPESDSDGSSGNDVFTTHMFNAAVYGLCGLLSLLAYEYRYTRTFPGCVPPRPAVKFLARCGTMILLIVTALCNACREEPGWTGWAEVFFFALFMLLESFYHIQISAATSKHFFIMAWAARDARDAKKARLEENNP